MGIGTHHRAHRLLLGLAIGASLLLAGGCRSTPPLALHSDLAASTVTEIGYRCFVRPAPDDAWSRKIRGWQQRERADVVTPSVAAEPPQVEGEEGGALRSKYHSFRSERRREIAREVADWIQKQAREHYIPDGAVDHWATLEETFRTDGDDCDGLELLTFHLLRELGFGDDEVYRAIVVRPSDGQHHMVTLWFEDRSDPWVIDPTGAMTSGMPRMSEVADWVPLKVFSEDRDFTVERGRVHTALR